MLTPDYLLIMLIGAVVGAGVWLLIIAIRGLPPRDPARPGGWSNYQRTLGESARRLLLGGAAGLVVLVATQWPVLAVALGLLAAFWDRIFGGAAAERAQIERLDGLASWTEALRDTIAGAVGLEQAIPATAINASPSIRPHLNLLVDRLRIREPMHEAMLKFADDLDDASADLIVAALVLNARLRGPGLREVLSSLAESAREELDLRRKVEAERRSTRRSVQVVVGITLGVAALLVLFNERYLEPYDTANGQLMLMVCIGIFAAGIMWLRRLAGVEVPERFLVQSKRHQEADVAAETVEMTR
ncbi:MAG: type II secretion system protein [Propionibacteriales bacterium]|nr:type II secretion system protein [Propionibacteriales bacterium]